MTSPTLEQARELIGRLLDDTHDSGDLRREAAAMIQDLFEGREAALAAEHRVAVETELGTKMAACGMVPLDAICAPSPLDKFMGHAGVQETAHFVEWVAKKAKEYGRMVAATQSGARAKNDEIDDFVLGKSAAFGDALINIHQTDLKRFLG